MGFRTVARVVSVSAGVALLSSCGAEPTAPSNDTSLQLTAAIDKTVVTRDAPALLTFRLRNVGTRTVTLTFPSSCQINPFIGEGASGRIVYPSGGTWACATVITSLALAPGAESVQPVTVRTADSSSSSASLVPGSYSAYATLSANEIQLRSDPVAFTVQ